MIAMLTASSSELHGWTSLLIKNVWLEKSLTDKQITQYRHLSVWLLAFILFVIVAIVFPSSFSLLFFFGNLYASLIPAVMYILITEHRTGPAPAIIVAIGSVIGIVSHLSLHSFFSIWASFLSACLLFIAFYLFNLQKYKKPME
ncbi:hypothetical protein OR571_11930 [Psychrobacillus sp. NEAU-3TGS]|uniref:hypothetical protein n=1 Tax=Psychrobacillus sp. NEAU-3TGS TaxID=2995412 RepID=UPI002496EC4A|nr:hypothetical protein [Psychrobacillus sp. NEAU-3TGS]MDI2587806.1 hypothetical protein [Psychrobacillus sp. NEAU-3TGS]